MWFSCNEAICKNAHVSTARVIPTLPHMKFALAAALAFIGCLVGFVSRF
jgi:hypothetical protein